MEGLKMDCEHEWTLMAANFTSTIGPYSMESKRYMCFKCNEEKIESKNMEEETKQVRSFDTGAIRDLEDGKEDYIETISWTAFRRYAQYMTECKKRYSEGNFKKGIPEEAYRRSALRHISKYLINTQEGGSLEPHIDHISAAIFNLFGILHEEERSGKRSFKQK